MLSHHHLTSHQEHISQYLISRSLSPSLAFEMAFFKTRKTDNIDVLHPTNGREEIKSTNHNAYNRLVDQGEFENFRHSSTPIVAHLSATWPPNFHIRLGLVCDLLAMAFHLLIHLLSRGSCEVKSIKSNGDAYYHLTSNMSLNTWYCVIFLLPLYPK
jgi:hypothetical protein